MATYPVEFHRRLEQKWESRIEQTLSPPIQSRWPGSRLDHGDTSLLCPSTGHRVHGWFADNGSEDGGEMYADVVLFSLQAGPHGQSEDRQGTGRPMKRPTGQRRTCRQLVKTDGYRT